jgi:hypothetical protein
MKQNVLCNSKKRIFFNAFFWLAVPGALHLKDDL